MVAASITEILQTKSIPWRIEKSEANLHVIIEYMATGVTQFLLSSLQQFCQRSAQKHLKKGLFTCTRTEMTRRQINRYCS